MRTIIRCRAVLFDLDGVIADSSVAVRRAWQHWAVLHGFEAESVLSRIRHGIRAIDQLAEMAPHLDAAAEERVFSAFEAEHTEGVVAVPGAIALLHALPADRWAIVTSGPRAVALARLSCVGAPLPQVLAPADEVLWGKPDPEGYLLGAHRLGVAASDCLVFEDAPAGVLAGKAAGARVSALLTSHPAEDLTAADWRIRDLRAVGYRGLDADQLVLELDLAT